MVRSGKPVLHDRFEFFSRHAGMGSHHDLKNRAFTPRECAFEIAFEQGSERLLGFPLGMLRRERLHTVEGKSKLEIDRLLGPERPVIIEGGNPLRLRHEVLAIGHGDAVDEIHDGLFGFAVIPRRQKVWTCVAVRRLTAQERLSKV